MVGHNFAEELRGSALFLVLEIVAVMFATPAGWVFAYTSHASEVRVQAELDARSIALDEARAELGRRQTELDERAIQFAEHQSRMGANQEVLNRGIEAGEPAPLPVSNNRLWSIAEQCRVDGGSQLSCHCEAWAIHLGKDEENAHELCSRWSGSPQDGTSESITVVDAER